MILYSRNAIRSSRKKEKWRIANQRDSLFPKCKMRSKILKQAPSFPLCSLDPVGSHLHPNSYCVALARSDLPNLPLQ